jgi:hypothetical protein
MSAMLRRLNFANVISLTALFVALGGGAYAVSIHRNSVTSKSIKNGQVKTKDLATDAVNASKVRDGSLLKQDFASGQLPAGATGPQGPQGVQGTTGAQGPEGEAAAFARIQADATLLPLVDPNRPPEDKVIDQSMVTHPETGKYCIDLPVPPSSAMVSLDTANASDAAGTAFVASVAIERGNNINPCTGTDARIDTTKVSGTATAAPVNPNLAQASERGGYKQNAPAIGCPSRSVDVARFGH